MGRKGGGGEGEARRRVGERAGQGGCKGRILRTRVCERWRGRVGVEGSGEGSKHKGEGRALFRLSVVRHDLCPSSLTLCR